MPNIKSAMKRVKVNKKKNLINRSGKSELKTTLKNFNALLEAGDVAACESAFKSVCSALDKAVVKGLIHKNTAANKKSGFAVRLNALKNA